MKRVVLTYLLKKLMGSVVWWLHPKQNYIVSYKQPEGEYNVTELLLMAKRSGWIASAGGSLKEGPLELARGGRPD